MFVYPAIEENTTLQIHLCSFTDLSFSNPLFVTHSDQDQPLDETENTTTSTITFSQTEIYYSEDLSADYVLLSFNRSEVVFSQVIITGPDRVFISPNQIAKSAQHQAVRTNHYSSTENPPSPHENQESVCEWTSGALHLILCSSSLSNVTLSGLTQGSILLERGNLTLEDVLFTHNGKTEGMVGARRNIACLDDATVLVQHVVTERLIEGLWFTSDGSCTFAYDDETTEVSRAFFFRPRITEVVADGSQLTIFGAGLFPCGLMVSLRAFDIYGFLDQQTDCFDIETHDGTTLTCQCKTVRLQETECEWQVVIRAGTEDDREQFIVQERVTHVQSPTQTPIIILIVVIIVLFAAGVALVAVFILQTVRRKKENNQPFQQTNFEMESFNRSSPSLFSDRSSQDEVVTSRRSVFPSKGHIHEIRSSPQPQQRFDDSSNSDS
ncbi:hypothetical protein BLNAU_8901 [Blattamonas nauphoetae]|uniref:Uncharacterized protein n=1 Tax=Blattamonas nauphoetae TaxID=2049346 RepID=A0ABQ9XXC2_9EUKA|nr:hypothetical protein BLNAU_8901 [Blattamonas nauphoetae]